MSSHREGLDDAVTKQQAANLGFLDSLSPPGPQLRARDAEPDLEIEAGAMDLGRPNAPPEDLKVAKFGAKLAEQMYEDEVNEATARLNRVDDWRTRPARAAKKDITTANAGKQVSQFAPCSAAAVVDGARGAAPCLLEEGVESATKRTIQAVGRAFVSSGATRLGAAIVKWASPAVSAGGVLLETTRTAGPLTDQFLPETFVFNDTRQIPERSAVTADDRRAAYLSFKMKLTRMNPLQREHNAKAEETFKRTYPQMWTELQQFRCPPPGTVCLW